MEEGGKLFMRAADIDSKPNTTGGCMVAQGKRADDQKARVLAETHGDAAAAFSERFISQHDPKHARVLADYVVVTQRGFRRQHGWAFSPTLESSRDTRRPIVRGVFVIKGGRQT